MNKRIKYILSTVFISILFLLLINNFTSKNIKSGSSIKIFVTTDIHYLAKSLTEDSEEFKNFATPKDGKQLFYIDEIMDAFIDDIKQDKPDFLVISGDLTNNGEKDSHLELSKKLDIIEKTGVKVFVIPGNHDTKNMWASGFKDGKPYAVESIDQEEFKKIYENFGYQEAILKDNNSLSYMVAPSEDIWLLMIDSNLYFEGEGMPTNRGIISTETLEWIKSCSEEAKEKDAKIITVMHHNLLKHSERMTEGNTIDNSSEVIELFKELELDIVLSGHIHIQNIAVANDDTITEIVTSALSVYPQQYGVIEYSKSTGFDYNTSKIKIDEWAEKKSLKDENLLNFSEYTKKAFYDRPYSRAYYSLEETGGYNQKEMEEMAELVGNLNLAYFQGNVFNIRDHIIKLPIYQLILDTDSDYVYDFVYSMIFGSKRDSSNIHIPKK